MRIAILADIHSNLEALEAVCGEMDRLGVDSVYFAGDVVGYGPDPNLCTRWVLNNADAVVAGNHDFAAVGMMDSDTFNNNARDAIQWNARQLEDDLADFLVSLPMVETRNGVTLVHASPRFPDQWEYIFTLWDAEENFAHFDNTFCFVGHSHQPVMVCMDQEGSVAVIPGDKLISEEGCRYLINVGSVGQPRDGNPDACFGLFDTELSEFSLIRSKYEVSVTQEKMHKEGLPPALADRLLEGR